MATCIATNTTNAASKARISVRGSSKMVSEFLYFGFNSILYQRGIYPADEFEPTSKYGMTLQQTQNADVVDYLKELFRFVQGWIESKAINRVVLVINQLSSGDPLERWQFDIDVEPESVGSGSSSDERRIREQMASTIRQIVSSVTYLPLIETRCAFDVLIYTTSDQVDIPQECGASGPRLVEGAQELELRAFSTTVHRVATRVSYRQAR